jgi:ubiquinone/menaquinone biosynthesis C-methylase UbiE
MNPTNKKSVFDKFALEYDKWFDENKEIYQSELLALKETIPINKKGLEVGIGTGRFASPLGIKFGVEPSEAMSLIALNRGIKVIKGHAEKLPFEDNSFDFVLFVTTICFLDDISKALKEAYRVLKENGEIIIGLIDKNSYLGKRYEKTKKNNKFYKNARFYSVDEIINLLEFHNFCGFVFYQTLVNPDKRVIEKPQIGYSKGSFVVVKSAKK